MAKPINTPSKSLEEIVALGIKLTPMMEQYYSIRKNYPGIILMFRMGDFYELFFDDAKNAARLLNISLTHRGKLGGYPIPMAGMPHHAAGIYIDRLTAMGMKVAICDQIEDPKHAKGIVKRAVTQVVSPGMPYDLDKTSERENSFMGSATIHETGFYLTLVDYTTGDFFGMNLNNEDDLVEKLNIYRPKEFITSLGQWDNFEKVSEYINRDSVLKTHLSEDYFLEKYTSLYIEKLIPTYKRDEVIKLNDGILAPVGALSYYICSTQSVEEVNHFRPFQMINSEDDMKITYPTLVGLEIFPKSRDHYKGSIVGFLDHTRTSMGTRKLKSVFKSPLRSEQKINERHDTIDYFLSNHELLESTRDDLSEIRDLERIMAKVSTGKVNGGDLLNLASANAHFSNITKNLKKLPKGVIPSFSKKEKDALLAMSQKVEITINDAIGANLDKGNLIKSGCNKKRDRLSKLNNNAVESLMELEAKYREDTKIPNLKIKHNNVAGYFIEISKSHTKKIPDNFVRRQTLVNAERYQSPELAEFEKEMVSAKDKLHKLEREIFDDIVSDVSTISSTILNLAHAIALIDVYQSFAWAAFQEDFTRPIIKKGKKLVNIKQGWHPLIKAAIKDQFVKHDITLDEKNFFGLITGPNMAGKTTVMREVAIVQFLTQVGCFVPAEYAEVGLCDYIFSRLGASDDIISGQSTFMVEMSETAEIIRHATSESLIILDEIGRGTSTYDGLSIAWSLVEYFVEKTKALTLFSTHYHELIDLVNTLDNAKNLTVKTINENGHVQFLYQLIEEGAAQSFGIHVAKLAGLPNEILNRSGQILGKLEKNHNHANDVLDMPSVIQDQMDLFTIPTSNPVIEEIESLDILNMTPMQAIQKLHDIKMNLRQ
jgi:DNA mismatch repair protein MutS